MVTCLIVDDSRVVRKVACSILASLGLKTKEAENGQVAIDLCEEEMPEVILLDWNMPVMSGIDFLKNLRRMENGSKPKVIFCTTESDMGHIEQALAAGADEYIMKPFDVDIMRDKLHEAGVI